MSQSTSQSNSQTTTTQKALIVIDPQNDYFPEGKYPLWNTETVLANMLTAIHTAQASQMPVVLVQHVGKPQSPFFQPETEGVAIHRAIKAAAPEAKVVIKHFADSFEQTELHGLLSEAGIHEIILCGMMTQNCITHTALSKTAEQYHVKVIQDACTTVDGMIHGIAINALSVRTELIDTAHIDTNR